jgi:hypothetical protein
MEQAFVGRVRPESRKSDYVENRAKNVREPAGQTGRIAVTGLGAL